MASHQKAIATIAAGQFKGETTPFTIRSYLPDPASGTVRLLDRRCIGTGMGAAGVFEWV